MSEPTAAELDRQRLDALSTRVAGLELKVEQATAPPTANRTLAAAIGRFGQIQADLHAVIVFLEDLAATEQEPDATARTAAIASIVARANHYIGKQQEQLATCMQFIVDVQAQADLVESSIDLARIVNLWEKIDAAQLDALLKVGEEGGQPAAVDLVKVRQLADEYRRVRREIGMYTIPRRIYAITQDGFGVGAPLDFHERFKEELPDAADRTAVLRVLSERRVDAVGGMVDVERGMLYRVGRRWRRWVSYLLLLAVAFAGLGLVYLVNQEGLGSFDEFEQPVLDENGEPVTDGSGAEVTEPKPFEEFWVPYLLMMAGVTAHIIKKAAELSIVERTRGGEGGPEVILDRLPLWIHVREYRFAGTVAAAILVFIGLAIADQADGATAFFAGYTIDSVADVALQRFNAAVSVHSADVKRALSSATA